MNNTDDWVWTGNLKFPWQFCPKSFLNKQGATQ